VEFDLVPLSGLVDPMLAIEAQFKIDPRRSDRIAPDKNTAAIAVMDWPL